MRSTFEKAFIFQLIRKRVVDYNQMLKVLLLLGVQLVAVLSWWDVGHMLTAAIAEIRINQLDPFASIHFRELVTSINALCDNRTRTFIESACWPDDLKGKQYNMNLFDPWHFKDSPYVVDTVVPVLNYTEGTVSSVEAMATATKVLKMNLLNNTAERALFARYVVHLVGDIHQPLHSVALFNKTYPKGDLGGNTHKVILTNGSTSNFHSYWDAGAYILQNDTWFITRPMNMQNLTALKDVAYSMITQYGKQVEELGKNIDPLVWAQESFRIAQNTTYPYIATTNKLDAAYNTLTYETSKKRITLAGYRLANYILEIYKTSQPIDLESRIKNPMNLWKLLAQDSRIVAAGQTISKFIKNLQIQTQ